MKLFENYTGNAMLNNALMTIEALADLEEVAAITPEVLLKLLKKHDLKSLNKRMKSYTMLFTKNGPLYNDATNGEKIYEYLLTKILENVEVEGLNTCEISGLKFNTTFNDIYINTLKEVGFSEKDTKNKDTSLNRNWFPLIGGLGSDAQALPQAKFTIQIHPICIVIMQFLPLSSLIYKGGLLLIDSSNFEFSRTFIAENVKNVISRIQSTSSNNPVENIKDLSKGNYLLKAIEILETKEIEDEYSDLNLWSFSNSGTGANCIIERVPNSLIKKLLKIKKDTRLKLELIGILSNSEMSYSFLKALEENQEWFGLYPNVYGSGKKRFEYAGVSAGFLEAYFSQTQNQKKTIYAKYLAYLINKYKSISFEKYLAKTDAWNEKEYRRDLYYVLIEATKSGEWNLNHHLEIIDDNDRVPLRNSFYNIQKITHFYYQKQTFSINPPNIVFKDSKAKEVCKFLIGLIQNDSNNARIIKNLINNQENISVNYQDLLIRSYKYDFLTLETIVYIFYDENFKSDRIGLNEILRIFFSQPEQSEDFDLGHCTIENNSLELYIFDWLEEIKSFAGDYQNYYFEKYKNRETGKEPLNKFLAQIESIPNDNSKFLKWAEEAFKNTNQFLILNGGLLPEKWSQDLFYTPNGEFSISFPRLAIKITLLKNYFLALQKSDSILSI